jgi:tape measure domain-containing protein
MKLGGNAMTTVRELFTLLGFKYDDTALKQFDKGVASAKAKSNALENAAKGIGTAYKWVAAAAGVAAGMISKAILSNASELEQYRNQLQKFTGDAQGAADVLSELRDKMGNDLFGTGNMVQAYKQLRNIGMGAENASAMMDVLGDVADGSAENFNALSGILTRVSVSGKVNAGTMRQLTNAGFGMDDMAQALGKSTKQLQAEIDAGRIGFKELTLAMTNATKEGGRFYQNMERQARTFSGSVKIMKSVLSDIGADIGTRVLPKIVDTIRYITELIKLGKDGFVNFGAKAFEALIHAIQDVIIFFQLLQMRMKKFGGAFTPIKAIFSDVFGFLKSVVESAYPFLMNLAMLFLLAFKPIQAFVKPVLESLKPIFKSVFGLLADILEELIPLVNGLTPHFEGIGKAIGKAFEKLVPVLENIKRAILAAFMPIKAFLKPIIESLQPLFEKVFGAIGKLFDQANKDTNGLADTIKSLTPLFSFLGKAVAFFVDIFGTGLAWVIGAIRPFLKYILLVIAAIKMWTIVQGILNVVSSLNPVGATIIAIIALVTAIGLLIKSWGKVKEVVLKVWDAIVGKVKEAWEFIKSILVGAIEGIKADWNAFLGFITALWEGIKNIASAIWNGIKEIFFGVVEGIKFVWGGLKSFFAGLWEGIKIVTASVWEGIIGVISGIVERIKSVWSAIIGFFSGLWAAVKQGPTEALEYIKNAFFGLFDSIKEKFFGFINVIKDGWDKVKGFFGGMKDKVVSFVTGGEYNSGQREPRTQNVNDMILTPEGQYSTHPDDYILAMRNPRDLLDSMIRFLNGSTQLQPAYAGAAGNSLVGHALNNAVAQNNYTTYNSPTSNYSNTAAPMNVTVNAPVNASGMSPDVASAMVRRGVEDALKNAINTSRGNIQSPEARRH